MTSPTTNESAKSRDQKMAEVIAEVVSDSGPVTTEEEREAIKTALQVEFEDEKGELTGAERDQPDSRD